MGGGRAGSVGRRMPAVALAPPAPGTDLAPLDPLGRSVPDATAAFGPHDTGPAVAHLREHGYVVVRGVVPPTLAERANAAFAAEVKPDARPYYRLSGRPEPHRRTEAGFMLQGLRDVQSLDRRHAPAFRTAALELLTHPALVALGAAALEAPATIVQTMYFEGNPATPPHQDTHYLDAQPLGTMVAAWIATEDIAPGAGRFYECPGTHRAELPLNSAGFNVVEHEAAYRAAVLDAMATAPVVAPALATGDVLVWSARTIHGSLPTSDGQRSRRSFTAHLIPTGAPFVQWHRRRVPLDLVAVNGVPVHHPKDLNRWRHRVRYHAERRFPAATAAAKGAAARYLFRR